MSAANPEQLYCCHTPRFNNFKNWPSHRYTSCQHPSRHCPKTQATRAAAVQGQLAAKGRAKCKSEGSTWGSSLAGFLGRAYTPSLPKNLECLSPELCFLKIVSFWVTSIVFMWVSVSSCCCDKHLNKSHRWRKGLFWSQTQVTVYHCGEVRAAGTWSGLAHPQSWVCWETDARTLPVHSSLSLLLDSSDLLPPTQNNLQYFRDLKHFLIYQKFIKEYNIVTES